jgi:molybdopterin converting factor small subunit
VETCAPTVGSLISELIARHHFGLPPALIRAAVGTAFVEPETELHDGDEIVLIPPVAGG